MKVFNEDQQSYYKNMMVLQEKLRKSEEQRIRLEERFNLLVQDSQNRHQSCINRLRIRYVEFLEEQKARDERNNKLLGSLEKVDNSLALMTAKTTRLNILRKHYEAYLLRVYGNQRATESVTADSGLESQNDQKHSVNLVFPKSSYKVIPKSINTSKYEEFSRPSYGIFNSVDENIPKPNEIEKVTETRQNFNFNFPRPKSTAFFPCEDTTNVPKNNYFLPNSVNDDPWKYSSAFKEEKVRTNEKEKNFPSLSNLSAEMPNQLDFGGDLDSYINKIKRLHAETLEREKMRSGSEHERSLDEFDQEQNTSGDLLNVTLSEELERPETREVASIKPKTSGLVLEKLKTSLPALTTAVPEGVQRSSIVDVQALLQQAKLAKLDAQSRWPVSIQPNPNSTRPGERLDPATEEKHDALEQHFESTDGENLIEDDYDDTVDIDSWMPDDVDPDRDDDDEDLRKLQQLKELHVRDQPKRKLESIEEVEQAEDEATLDNRIVDEAHLQFPQNSLREVYDGNEQYEQANYENQEYAIDDQEQPYQQNDGIVEQQENNDHQQLLNQQQMSEVVAFEQQPGGEQYLNYDDQYGQMQQGYTYDASEFQDNVNYETQQPQEQQQQQQYFAEQYGAEYMGAQEGYPQEEYDPNQAEIYEETPHSDYPYHGQQYIPSDEYQEMPVTDNGDNNNDNEPQKQTATVEEENAEKCDDTNAQSSIEEHEQYQLDYPKQELDQELEAKPNSDDEMARHLQSTMDDEVASSSASFTKRRKDHPKVADPSESTKKKKDVIKSILDSDSESLIERKLSNSESDFDFN